MYNGLIRKCIFLKFFYLAKEIKELERKRLEREKTIDTIVQIVTNQNKVLGAGELSWGYYRGGERNNRRRNSKKNI